MPVKLIAAGDIANLFGIAVLGAISWILPEPRWLGFCRAVGRFNLPMMTSDTEATLGAIGAALGEHDVGATPKTIAERAAAEELLGTLQLLRDYRPGGWRPPLIPPASLYGARRQPGSAPGPTPGAGRWPRR